MSVKISYRKDRERWQVEYKLDGKRKRPLFLEKTEADNFARRLKFGVVEDPNSISIFDAGHKYYENVSVKKSPKSKCNDKLYINLHHYYMTEVRGVDKLSSVQLEDMEAFRDWLPLQKKQPWPISEDNPKHKPMAMGPSSVNRCLRVLKHFYRRHIQWKSIKDTPCMYLEFLEADESVREVMTHDQYLATLEKADDWFKPVLQFMYLTGSPAICVERLRWEDVDLRNRTYCTIRKKGRKAKLKRTYFGMTNEVFATFVLLRNSSPAVDGAVFRDGNGIPLLADRVTRLGNEARVAAGVSKVTLYGLRHALATDLTEANVNLELVRRAMGHQNIATTQRYANKVGLSPVAGAIETVRGGNLVAKSNTDGSQLEAGVGS